MARHNGLTPEENRVRRMANVSGRIAGQVAQGRGFRTMADVPMVEDFQAALRDAFKHAPTPDQWTIAIEAWFDGYMMTQVEWEGMEYA